jgi:replicative DNA helicase
MQKENISFSKYGKNFQEVLAYLILEDRPFSEQIEEVLDVNFFELNYLKVFVSKVFEYRKKYKAHPTSKIFDSIIRTELDDETEATREQVRRYFARSIVRASNDSEYIKSTALDFCKKQKLKEAILKSVNLLQNSSFDEIKKVIDNALNLGIDNDYGHDFHKDFEARYELKARNPITTGWEKLDSLTKNGLGKGELGVVIAPTGAGKSMVLAHLGSEAVKAGHNVIHYTLELSEEVTGLRYDSCISGVRLGDLHAMKDMVYDSIKEVEGQLIIKEYPTKSATVNILRSHLEKLQKNNTKIGMIIVDYGDLLKPVGTYREKRNELESIYEGLRALAQEFECPVWTASQTNRSGLNAEVITMESISEAFSKCFVADMIFSVSRTIEDKNTNQGRIFVAKNRNGPDGLVFPIFMDTSRVKIKMLDAPIVSEEKKPVNKLVEIYQKSKKEFNTNQQEGKTKDADA